MAGIPIDGKFHVECPMCGSSDGAVHYIGEESGDEYIYCHACDNSKTIRKGNGDVVDDTQPAESIKEVDVFQKYAPINKSIRDGISISTLSHFGVRCKMNEKGQPIEIVFPYYDASKCQVAYKKRKADIKGLWFRPDNVNHKDIMFFGSQTVSKNAKKITICEGEFDAMAHYEMMGEWPVVSVKDGSKSVKKLTEAEFEFLNQFEEIYVSFDADDPGREAATKLAEKFPSKTFIVDLAGSGTNSDGEKISLKDANDYLKHKEQDTYRRLWWNAKKWSPSDIIPGSTLIDSVVNKKTEEFVETPWDGLNNLIYGLHRPDLVLISAGTGVGKSFITAEITDHLLLNTDFTIADLSIEDSPERRAETLVSVRLRRPLHFPEVREEVIEMELEKLRKSAEDVLGGDRVLFYDKFGADDADAILSRIDYFVENCGCQVVTLDHISYLASYHQDEERKALDSLSNKLAAKVINSKFCLIEVAHINRQGLVHGSSNMEKTAWVHLDLSRDKEHENPEARNLLTCVVKKNRRYGRTGEFFLRYKENPFGLTEVDPEEAKMILSEKEFDDDSSF